MLFRQGEMMVFQIQLTHKRDAVPLTRDYITDYDRQNTAVTRPERDDYDFMLRERRSGRKVPAG